MRWLGKASLRFFQGQRGISILETLAAVGILGFIGVAFLSALSTTTKSTGLYEQRFTASVLAQSQIEILKATAYDDTDPYYESVSSPASMPPGYDILIYTVPQEDGNKQEITVKVIRDGHHLFELTTIKANW
ncbi:hypothetical protein LCGC14_1032790 [marine sediment metagenome]|uniref:Type II secretion system protein GspI C-terminal domain-containing protein n=1 Tax=marine sediment metagenome TaxID=412755 RepID=A0A0F9MYQ8_9ZZZZ